MKNLEILHDPELRCFGCFNGNKEVKKRLYGTDFDEAECSSIAVLQSSPDMPITGTEEFSCTCVRGKNHKGPHMACLSTYAGNIHCGSIRLFHIRWED